jgi:hypothetical protein
VLDKHIHHASFRQWLQRIDDNSVDIVKSPGKGREYDFFLFDHFSIIHFAIGSQRK